MEDGVAVRTRHGGRSGGALGVTRVSQAAERQDAILKMHNPRADGNTTEINRGRVTHMPAEAAGEAAKPGGGWAAGGGPR